MEFIRRVSPAGKVRFTIVVILLLCIVFSSAVLLTDGIRAKSPLFYEGDSFMDTFNPIVFTRSEDPYENVEMGAIYPYINYSWYQMVGKTMEPYYSDANKPAIELSRTQSGLMYIVVSSCLAVALICLLIFGNINTREVLKLIFALEMVVSSPFLYLLERGNTLLFALVLTLFFTFYHDSENKILRELSLIALAIAASLKIYPAVFGFMLLKKGKSFAPAIRCAVYGLLFFFVPFLIKDGGKSVITFYNNLLHGISVTVSYNLRVDFYGALVSFAPDLALQLEEKLGGLLTYIPMLAITAAAFLTKDSWKRCLALSLICVMLPAFSYYYAAVIYIIPLAMLMRSCKGSITEYVYGLLLCGTLATLFLPSGVSTDPRLICQISELALAVVLILDTIFRCIRSVIRRISDAGRNKVQPAT